LGLELGSDDYLPKPFLPRELVLRVKRLLKTRTFSRVTICGYVIDSLQRAIFYEGLQVDLTFKEYEMAYYFMVNPNKALSREEILDKVWGQEYFGSTRVVDDTLRRLRKKMDHLMIEVVYGYGYILKAVEND
jgi:two-component system response regulator CssR